MTRSVLFVCLGNICRSPTAEGVMRHLLAEEGLSDQVLVDSAGTGGWHKGEPPDRRATLTARERDIVLSGQSRVVRDEDFDRFDHIVAMDTSNLRTLQRMARTDALRAKVTLLRDYDADSPPGSEVPDPYYGGERGFEVVLDVCEAGCRGLLRHLRGLGL